MTRLDRTLLPSSCTHRDDVDFFTHMEMYMRQEKPTLCGRDHISYRSYYLPAKVSMRCKDMNVQYHASYMTEKNGAGNMR